VVPPNGGIAVLALSGNDAMPALRSINRFGDWLPLVP